jgi:DNA-binding MarR family transcriptional regulator
LIAAMKTAAKPTKNGAGAARLAQWLGNSDLAIGLRLAVMMNLIVRPYGAYKAKYGLPLMDWRVMMCIAAAPGATAQDIADFGGFDKMTISVSLKRLIARGRVARRPDPADGRRMLLQLTSAGRAIYRELGADVRKMEAKLMTRLSADDRSELSAVLDRLIVALRPQ